MVLFPLLASLNIRFEHIQNLYQIKFRRISSRANFNMRNWTSVNEYFENMKTLPAPLRSEAYVWIKIEICRLLRYEEMKLTKWYAKNYYFNQLFWKELCWVTADLDSLKAYLKKSILEPIISISTSEWSVFWAFRSKTNFKLLWTY